MFLLEREPSGQNVKHVPDLKLIHVRLTQKFHLITNEESYESEIVIDYYCGVDRSKHCMN